MMALLEAKKTMVRSRIESDKRCNEAFKELVNLVDPAPVPTKVKPVYKIWTK